MGLEMLSELGFSAGQVSVYRAVLNLGIASIGEIQENTGIERRNIYDILNKLIDQGYVSYTETNGKKTYACTHPNKILEELKLKEKNLKDLENEVPKIEEMFNIARPNIGAQIFRGNDAIKALFEEMLEHDTYWIGGNSGVETSTNTEMKLWFKQWTNRRITAGKYMFDLVDHGSWLEGLEPNKIDKHKKSLYKYCELPPNLSSPMVMIMFGNKVVQILWREDSFAFVLESEEIKESFMKYFNYFWKEPW